MFTRTTHQLKVSRNNTAMSLILLSNYRAAISRSINVFMPFLRVFQTAITLWTGIILYMCSSEVYKKIHCSVAILCTEMTQIKNNCNSVRICNVIYAELLGGIIWGCFRMTQVGKKLLY